MPISDSEFRFLVCCGGLARTIEQWRQYFSAVLERNLTVEETQDALERLLTCPASELDLDDGSLSQLAADVLAATVVTRHVK